MQRRTLDAGANGSATRAPLDFAAFSRDGTGRRSIGNVFDRFAVAGVLIAVGHPPHALARASGRRSTTHLFELIAFQRDCRVADYARCRTWRSVRLCPTLDVPLALFWMLAAVSGLSAYRDLGAPALIPFGIELTVRPTCSCYSSRRDLISRHQMFRGRAHRMGLCGAPGRPGGCCWHRRNGAVHARMSSLTYDGARLLATFRNPNRVAAYLVPSVVLFTALWASTRRLRWGHFAVAAALTGACVLWLCRLPRGDVAAIAGWIGILLLLLPGRPAARVVAANDGTGLRAVRLGAR